MEVICNHAAVQHELYFLTNSFMCTHVWKAGVMLHTYFVFTVSYTINYTGDIFPIVHNLQTTYKLHVKPLYSNTINNYHHLAPVGLPQAKAALLFCY